MNEEKITIHMDYINGMPWIECGDDLPMCEREYSTFPVSVFVSIPCNAVAENNRIIEAVYVRAVSAVPNNDGSRTKWEGWCEKTGEADDYSCVENVLQGNTINVIRWHYPKGTQKPTQKSLEKMAAVNDTLDYMAKVIDSHPKEWPLVQDDGTVLATGPAEIVNSGTEQVNTSEK